MTEPLTPPDCDLRDFPSMLLDVARLRDSTLASNESGDAFRAAVLLWAASWHQLPAASLPDDDQWIATTAGYALRGKIDRAWTKVRAGALRKYVKCSDGRLYHPVVAEKALECWLSKLASRLSSGAGNAKRHKIEFDPKPIEAQMAAAKTLLSALNPQSRALTRRRPAAASPGIPEESGQHPDGIPDGSPAGSQEKDKGKGREGSSEANASGAAGAPPPVDKSTNPENQPPASDSAKRAAWSTCGKWMVANGIAEATAREVMGKLLKDFPAVALEAFAAAPKQAETPNPSAYLVATAKALDEARVKAAKSTHPTPSAEETAEALRRQSEDRQAPTDPEAQAAIEAAAARAKVVRDRIAGVTA